LDDDQRLSALIGEIYDAAIEPERWPVALAGIRDFAVGCAVGLYSKDASRKSGNLHYDDGRIEPRYAQLYFEKYVKVDPSNVRHFFGEICEPMATVDLMPYDEFVQSRFYKEWAVPQGLVDHIAVVLDRSTTSVAMFGVFRHARQGLADEAMRRRMRLLAPHVRRAVLIGRTIDLGQDEAASFADTIDGLAAGTFLVDETARIVHANRAGYAMLAAPGPVRAAGGRLEAVASGSDQAFHDIFAACGKGDAAIGVKGIAVPLGANGGDPYVAHILPLTSGARRKAGRGYAATAAVFVQKASITTPSPPEVIAKAYRLTPTELRVLLAIVEVGGVPEVAEALGVAETTVKTHLRSLFEKTETNRQVDLAKLVAGFSNPMLD
jgi:DNA-binding CsgD family transcriptional regulator